MDDTKRATLLMMEEVVLTMGFEVAGHELTEQVVEYMEDGDYPKAQDLLYLIDSRYWDGPAQKHASSSKHYAEVLAKIIEHFGIYLDVFKNRGASS